MRINAAARSGSAQDVYQQLKSMILGFELYPGSRVTESELAVRFGVSRTPVREALQRLENEGYLSVRPKQGCFIRELDIEAIEQHYQVRIALEMCALEIACTHMSDRAVRELAEEWDPATAPAELAVEEMAERDESFHLALAEGGGNFALADYLRDVNQRIHVIRRLDFTDARRIALTYQEHHTVLQLLLRRDIVAAQQALTHHIRRSQSIAKTVTLEQLSKRRHGGRGPA